MAESISALIAKLRAHAESAQRIGSLREAEAFAAKVRELMLRHNISEEAAAEALPPEVFSFYPGDHGFRPRAKSAHPWEWLLADAAARFCFAAAALSRYSNVIHFYGRRINCEAAVSTYAYLLKAALRHSRDGVLAVRREDRRRLSTGRSRKRFRHSFSLGFARSVHDRASRKIEAPAEAMVRLNQAIAEAESFRDRDSFTSVRKFKRTPMSLLGLIKGIHAGVRFDVHHRERLGSGAANG